MEGLGFWLPRPRRHWTPQYIKDRVQLRVWERRHPDSPWLVPEAVALLETWLRPADSVVEFGSGRSTLWLASRVAKVLSVEHDRQWFLRVATQLETRGVRNVGYHHVVVAESATSGEQERAYLEPVIGIPKATVNMVLVDGILRDAAAAWALEHVGPGGIVVIDNVNRYIPRTTRSPGSLGARGKPPTERWRAIGEAIREWRQAWFSNGVTDTAIFFRD